jgi:hypothetical protein
VAGPDDTDVNKTSGSNVLPFVLRSSNQAGRTNDDVGVDDDELLKRALDTINEWKAAPNLPSLTLVQTLFHELICDGGSNMLRDKVVDAVMDAFGKELGGKRGLASTWTQIAKEVVIERAQAARERGADSKAPPLTVEQKAGMRDALWPTIRDLAEAPDLMDRVVRQVQAMGVVNEAELITLIYIAGTSRVLDQPLPIRFLPTPPRCRVLPGTGVKLRIGRCGNAARDAEQ